MPMSPPLDQPRLTATLTKGFVKMLGAMPRRRAAGVGRTWRSPDFRRFFRRDDAAAATPLAVAPADLPADPIAMVVMASAAALAIRAKISFLISSGCRAGASPARCTKRQPERLPYKQNAFACVLSDSWGSVSQKALLQDQLSKGMRAGRARVQQERCERIPEICEQPVILERKIDIGKNAVTSRPTLGDSRSNSPQDFAALHLRRLFLLLFRFGMKRAGRLPRSVFCCHRRERTMIRDRNPGTDRNRNGHVAHACFHTQCWLGSARTRPRFKSPDISGSPHSK